MRDKDRSAMERKQERARKGAGVWVFWERTQQDRLCCGWKRHRETGRGENEQRREGEANHERAKLAPRELPLDDLAVRP